MILKIYKHFMSDALYRSSIFVILSTLVVAVFGFVFWIVVARLFPAKNVGIATTLISAMSLLNTFSLLGLNTGLIRYLPKSTRRNEKINSAFILIIVAALIAAVIFLSSLKFFSPHLLFLQTSIVYLCSFSLLVIGASLNLTIDSIFIAYRASNNILIKNIVMSVLKLVLPFVFIFLGAYGIFMSVSLATFISSILGMVILIVNYKYKPTLIFNTSVIKEMAFFSSSNYIAGFLSNIPALVLPLLIINKLSAEIAAYYYIASMILSFLIIIPSAATSSFLAEGSYNQKDLLKHFVKAFKIIYIILLPSVIMTFFFGNFILHAFGKSYALEAFSFLRIVSVSSLFIAISYLGSTILKIRHQMKSLIVTNALGAVIVLGFCYFSLPYGLIGIGYGWVLGQIFLAGIYFFLFVREFSSLGRLKGLNLNLN